MENQNLNKNDIQTLRDAVRTREAEIERLRRSPVAGFEIETKIANEISGHRAIAQAYRRLINIHENKTAQSRPQLRLVLMAQK